MGDYTPNNYEEFQFLISGFDPQSATNPLDAPPWMINFLNSNCCPEYLTSDDLRLIGDPLDEAHGGLWKGCARLYTILTKVQMRERYSAFSARRMTDANFPFSNANLPGELSQVERSVFLKAQRLVLTSPAEFVNCERGEHVYFPSGHQTPFKKLAVLGGGGSGQVDVVESSLSAKKYARKIVRRHAFGRFQEDLSVFRNELRLLKTVRHRHIVRIVGSYTDPSYAALLMSPIAECDLSHFLRQTASSTTRENLGSLRTFFGCLANAIAYLHKKRIRHKDIKPSNFLVHNGEILVTDFGLSRDCNDTRSTTEGPTGRTPKYASPEVADHAPRSFSSDIWSLGCIFMEMITVLKGLSLQELSEHMAENGTMASAYHANDEAIELWMDRLRSSNDQEGDNAPLAWIQEMMLEDRQSRPGAAYIYAAIIGHRSPNDRIGEWCGLCCRTEDDDEEMLEEEHEDTTRAVTEEDKVVIKQSVEDEPRQQETPVSVEIQNGHRDVSEGLFVTNEDEMTVRGNQGNAEILRSTPSDRDELPDMTGLLAPAVPFDSGNWPNARFFLLRSNCEVNIEVSAAHEVWTCNPATNTMLDRAYSTNTGPIMLIFSVVQSRKFCGIARMVGRVDKTTDVEHWQGDSWHGQFPVKWKSWTEVDYDDCADLTMKEDGQGPPITRIMNGMEICRTSGVAMMRKFGLLHGDGDSSMQNEPSQTQASNAATASASTAARTQDAA